MVGEKQLWATIDSLREAMGKHRGTGVPIWEAWCEENGVDWEDLRKAASAYLPSFKQWLDDSCLAEAAVDMWLHAFQVGLLVARAEAPSIRSQERQRVRGELFSELEGAGWSSDEEIPAAEVEAAFDRILERATLDSLEDEDGNEPVERDPDEIEADRRHIEQLRKTAEGQKQSADGFEQLAGEENERLANRLEAEWFPPDSNNREEAGELDSATTHELKCWPPYFEHVLLGRKTFECRSIADRTFKVGDLLLLREYDGSLRQRQPDTEGYTGRTCKRRVTYMLGNGDYGIKAGHVVLALGPAGEEAGER